MLKLAFTFLITLATSFGFFECFFHLLSLRQEEVVAEQSRLILNDVKYRFSLFMNVPVTVGLLSADNLASGDFAHKNYGRFARKVLKINKEILGMNLLDANGVIIEVYPQESNFPAKNQVTQNLADLRNSFQRNEPYWFSHPFKLFQGQLGFVFYVPIVKAGTLTGWVASVISAGSFFREFRDNNYFESHELIIRDKLTNGIYFATADDPEVSSKVFESVSEIRGRDLAFQSWRKSSALTFDIPWYLTFWASVLMASFFTFGMILYQQRKKSADQLQNISTLLGLTAKEALSNLVDIHSEINKLGETGYVRTGIVSRDVFYITNLIEQIDLLQTFAAGGEELRVDSFELRPLIEAQIQDMTDIIQKKSLHIDLDEHQFAGVLLDGNKWLFQNTVLRNALTHSVLLSREGSNILIDHKILGINHHITFYAKQIYVDSEKNNYFKLDRRLDVTQNVLKLFRGQLYLQRDLKDGLTIKITVPITKKT